MPRYFFNIYHERDDLDDLGEDLPDQNAAWQEAIRTTGQLLQDIDGRLPPGKEWRMEVTDESRNAIYDTGQYKGSEMTGQMGFKSDSR